MAKSHPELEKINIYIKLFAHVTDKETRWVKDSPFKICACYLACKLTDLSDREIGTFFDINPVFMRSQVVQYDYGAGLNLRHQHLAHIGREGPAIHGTLYDPRRDQGFMGQSCDQCLRPPTPKGRIHIQSLAAQ